MTGRQSRGGIGTALWSLVERLVRFVLTLFFRLLRRPLTEDVLEAAEILAQKGIAADVYKLLQIHPLPAELPAALLGYKRILFAEEAVQNGGIGEHLALRLLTAGWQGQWMQAAVPNVGLPHASVKEIKQTLGLDGASLAARLCEE